MALHGPWDRYETALLIETYMHIKNNLMTRDEGVNKLSSRLRNYAIVSGKEIDEIYRNQNGISLRLHELGYLFGDEEGIRNTSYLFRGMVDMYKNENTKYQEILKEAKQNIPNVQDDNVNKTINKEPKKIYTYPSIRKKESVVKEGLGSKLMRYFRNIIPKNEVKIEKNSIDEDAINSFLDYLDRNKIEYVDKSDAERKIWIIDRPEYSKVIKSFKRIGLNMHFNYNIGKVKANCTAWWIDCNEITSNLLEKIILSKPMTKDNVEQNSIYVHLPPKINITKKLESVTYKDDLAKFLDQNHIEYYDMRNKRGCLWIAESSLTTMLIIGLTDEKILFQYSSNGGKVCNYKSAWWTKSSDIKFKDGVVDRLVDILNKNRNNTLLLNNEQKLEHIEFIDKKLTSREIDILLEYLKIYGVRYVDDREKHERICLIEDAASKIIIKKLQKVGLVFHYTYNVRVDSNLNGKNYWWIKTVPVEVKEKEVNKEIVLKASSDFATKVGKETSPVSVDKITKVYKITNEGILEKRVKLEQSLIITKEAKIEYLLTATEIDDLIIRLTNDSVQFLDNREKEGKFWIFDGPRTAPFITELRDKGVSLHYKYIVGFGVKHKGSWWIEADRKPTQVVKPKVNVVDTVVEDCYKDNERMFFGFLRSKNIKYVDSRNIDHFLWLLDGVETFKVIKRIKKQGITCALKLDGGKLFNQASAWNVKVEELFADDVDMHAIISENELEITYSSKNEEITEIEEKNDTEEKETIETKVEKNNKEILQDEETSADRIYCFMHNSLQTYPKGLTMGYVSYKLDIPLEKVRAILVRADWVENNGLLFVLNDKIKDQEQRVKFHKNISLAYTRPIALRYLKNEKIGISSWREVLLELSKVLYKDYKHVFEKLSIRNEVYKVVDGRHKQYLKAPGNIGDNLWIELSRTPEDIIKFIKVILRGCNVLTDKVEITYVRKEVEVPIKGQVASLAKTKFLDEQEKGKKVNPVITPEKVEEKPFKEITKEICFDLSNIPNLDDATLVRATYRSVEVFTVDSWRRLLINLAMLLYFDFSKKLNRIAMRNEPDKIVDGRHKSNFVNPFNIGGNLWIESERSNESIIDFIRVLLTGCNLSLGSVQIVCRVVDKVKTAVEEPATAEESAMEISKAISEENTDNSYNNGTNEQRDALQNAETESIDKGKLDYQVGGETYKGILVDEKVSFRVDFCNLESYAYTRPIQFNYFGKICEPVSSWRQVMIRISTLLYEDHPDILKGLAEDEECKTIYSGAKENLLRVSRKISDDLFIETNCSAQSIVAFIKMLLIRCCVDFDNIDIIYINKNSSELGVSESLNKEAINEDTEAELDVDEDSSRYEQILKDKFPRGLRFNSFIDIKKFARFYNEAFNIELDIKDKTIKDSISSKLAKVGIVYGEKVFSIDNLLSDRGKEILFNYIEEQFSKGVKALAYSAVYTQLSEELLDEKINDENMLQTYLRHECKGKYYFDSLYLYRDRNANIDIDEEIVDLMHSRGTAMSIDDVAKVLYYLPKDRIEGAFKAKEFIRNAKSEYFHISMIDLTKKEIDEISKIIQDEIDINLFASGIDLISIIRKRKPELLERFNQFTDLGLRNAIGYMLNTRFSFVGNVISSLDKPVAMKDVFSNFGKLHEDFTLAELRQFRTDLNTIIYFDNLYENAVRVSHDQFVNKKYILFDVKNTDKAISVLCQGEYISLKDITLFSSFPYCRYSWNEYLLECYVANYSEEYKLLHTGFNEDKIVGVIVKKSSGYDTLDDIFTDVLARSGIELTVDNALQYLYDQGYLARRLLSNIEQIVINAKAKKG